MKRIIKRFLAAFIAVIILWGAIPYQPVHAATTKEKLEEAKRQQEEAKKKAEQAQKEVDSLTNRKNKLNKELEKLKAELDRIFERISYLEGLISEKESEIEQTEADLADARDEEAKQYEAMKKRIQFMYENSETVYLDILFHAKTFSDLITMSRNMESLADYDRKKFEEFKQLRISIEVLEAKLQSEKADLDGLMAETETEKGNVLVVIDKTNANIAEYNDLIDEAEQVALAKEKELAAANNSVEKLKKQLAEEERLARLAASLAWRSISEVSFEPDDRYKLAVLIYCEAGGEPYEGQIAVGAVVINRLLSGAFPNTLEGVIRQKWQFSPVASGRYDHYLAIGKTSQSCYNAADAAMSGYTNVSNCLFFRTPIEGYGARYQIGGHVFK
ncbi:MAG: cell wall hydrolase [Lachnospiraceae bacterium]|nr:cell wall hydrolase [Lachnospiraceae bacterium]